MMTEHFCSKWAKLLGHIIFECKCLVVDTRSTYTSGNLVMASTQGIDGKLEIAIVCTPIIGKNEGKEPKPTVVRTGSLTCLFDSTRSSQAKTQSNKSRKEGWSMANTKSVPRSQRVRQRFQSIISSCLKMERRVLCDDCRTCKQSLLFEGRERQAITEHKGIKSMKNTCHLIIYHTYTHQKKFTEWHTRRHYTYT